MSASANAPVALISTRVRTLPSVRVQTAATALAVVAAVALPQCFHAVGAVSGLGTALGETFLPMHLPVLMVGLLAGPWAGLATGALAPAVSFALSGMPMAAMLPFMIIELAGYGLVAGLLRGTAMPTIAKVLVAQVAGRAVRALAVLVAVFALGNSAVAVASIWMSVVTGLPGLILQWALIPLLAYWIDSKTQARRA